MIRILILLLVLVSCKTEKQDKGYHNVLDSLTSNFKFNFKISTNTNSLHKFINEKELDSLIERDLIDYYDVRYEFENKIHAINRNIVSKTGDSDLSYNIYFDEDKKKILIEVLFSCFNDNENISTVIYTINPNQIDNIKVKFLSNKDRCTERFELKSKLKELNNIFW